MAAHQAPLSTEFSRQEHWSGLPVPSPMHACMHAKLLQSCPTVYNPMDSSPPGSSAHRILQTRALEWVARSFSDTAVKNQEIISDPEIPTGSRVMRMFLHHRPHFEEEEFPLRGRLDNFILISHGRNEEIPIL